VKKLAPELLAVSAVLDSPAAPGGRGQICGGRVSVLYSGESAAQIAALLAGHLGEQLVSPPASVDGINTDALRATSASTSGAASTLLFLLECEQDGMLAADARKLQRELKKAADSACLAGCHVAVLALARSVCAFSAASTGADKYSGATKLQAVLTSLGASAVLPLGCAEIEVEEVEVAVLPWFKRLQATVRCEEVPAVTEAAVVHVLHSGGVAGEVAELLCKGLQAARLVPMVQFSAWSDEVELVKSSSSRQPLFAIFIVSTIENEQPPEDAGRCVRFFNKASHPPQMLRHLRYAVLGLGDSNLLLDRQTTTAKDCNQVAQRLDAKLQALGASSFFSRGEADDRTGNKEVEPWLSGVREAAERVRSHPDAPSTPAPAEESSKPLATPHAEQGADAGKTAADKADEERKAWQAKMAERARNAKAMPGRR